MKKVKLIAVVFMMLATTLGFADEPKISLTANSEKSLLIIMNTIQEDTKISILDKEGIAIYWEYLDKVDTYRKEFNLANLPKGSYILIVENALSEVSYSIDLHTSNVEIIERKETAKPIFRKDGKKVFLNLLNLEKEEVKIRVFDVNDRLLFEEIITDEQLVEKVFNFESAYDGIYTIKVQKNKNSYFEVVSI